LSGHQILTRSAVAPSRVNGRVRLNPASRPRGVPNHFSPCPAVARDGKGAVFWAAGGHFPYGALNAAIEVIISFCEAVRTRLSCQFTQR
jgi:hypothetical protein